MVYGFNKNFNGAKTNASGAVHKFTEAGGSEAFKAAEETAANAAKNAARDLSKSHIELKSARGEIFGSIQNLFGRMGEVIGLKPYAKGTEKTVAKVTELASKGRASKWQRLISKPIRVAADNPKTSLFALGALAVVGIGSAIRGRAARRTEAEIEANAQMGGYADPASYSQQPVAPQYQVTAEDMAAMNARMKGGNGPQAGHADALLAPQNAAQAPTASAQL
jgi:hypothetical protein